MMTTRRRLFGVLIALVFVAQTMTGFFVGFDTESVELSGNDTPKGGVKRLGPVLLPSLLPARTQLTMTVTDDSQGPHSRLDTVSAKCRANLSRMYEELRRNDKLTEKVDSWSFGGRNTKTPRCSTHVPDLYGISNTTNHTRAYVTFITSKDFAMPAAVLMYSIAATGSPYARVVLVTPDVGLHDRRLLSVFAEVIEIENIPAPLRVPNPRYVNTFTKLRVWQLAMYRKVVYVDTDVTVVRNMDELFEIDGWGVTMDAYHDRYSTGLMVLEPSNRTFRNMMVALQTTKVSMELPDLLFLKEYFSTRGKQVNIIPRWYHVYQDEFSSGSSFLTNYKSSVPVTDPRIHGIHYPGDNKPWSKTALPKGDLMSKVAFFDPYMCKQLSAQEIAYEPKVFWFIAHRGMRRALSTLYDINVAVKWIATDRPNVTTTGVPPATVASTLAENGNTLLLVGIVGVLIIIGCSYRVWGVLTGA